MKHNKSAVLLIICKFYIIRLAYAVTAVHAKVGA